MNMEIARRTRPQTPVDPSHEREDGEIRQVRAVPNRTTLQFQRDPSQHQDVPWRRFWAAFIMVLCLVATAYPLLPKRFESSASVVLQPTDLDGQGDRSMRAPLDENAIQSVIDLVASPALADAVIRSNGLAADPEFVGAGGMERMSRWLATTASGLAAEDPWVSSQVSWLRSLLPDPEPVTQAQLRRRLRDHLQVSRDKRSYTLRMGYWSASPGKAAAMTASLLDAYLSEQRERKRRSLERLTDWLGHRVGSLTERHEAAMAALASFMAESGLVDTGAGVSLDQRLQILSMEAAQARARAIEAFVRLKTLDALKSRGDLGSAPEVLGAPAILKLKEGMASALSRTAVWASETKALQDQIALESERIVTAARAEAENWSGREALLQGEIEAVRAVTVKRRQAEPRLQELQRVANFEKVLLEEGLTRLKAASARDAVIGADSDVLSVAEVPSTAAFPRPGLTLLAAVFMALLTGLAAIWRSVLVGANRLATS